MNPFQVLGVEPKFDLALADLEERHRSLSRALHPDKFAGASASERRIALSRAIEVNEAFRALRDPIRRAEVLLELAGAPVGETREPKPSPSLLMEMMESREELSDAARKKDLEAIAGLSARMTARRDAASAALSAALGVTRDYEEALRRLGELRYTRRFLEEVDAFRDALDEA